MDVQVTAMAASLLDMVHFHVSSVPNMVFFSQINDFLDDEIAEFATNLLVRTGKIVAAAATVLVTLWIAYQGWQIVTGRSRDSMMALATHSLRAVLVVGIALGAAASSGGTYRTLTEGLNGTVRWTITGHDGPGTYADIDKTLGIMQVALQVIDSVDSGDDLITDKNKDRALMLTSVGLGGPAIMAATALLLNKIAMALIVGLGPIFILCLLFEQTRPLFGKWLYYGIGTLFSMAFLTVMVTLALDMVIAVGLAFWLPDMWLGSNTESLTSMAMQQGGMGVILTMLIVSAPPMAAMFFHGVLGQYQHYNPLVGQAASPPGSGLPPMYANGGSPSRAMSEQSSPGTGHPHRASLEFSTSRLAMQAAAPRSLQPTGQRGNATMVKP